MVLLAGLTKFLSSRSLSLRLCRAANFSLG